jgi:hypothetical protein
VSDQTRLDEIAAHYQEYLDAVAETERWEALGDSRPIVGPVFPPVAERYGQEVGWLIKQVKALRKGIGAALQELNYGDVTAELRATRRDFDRANRAGMLDERSTG